MHLTQIKNRLLRINVQFLKILHSLQDYKTNLIHGYTSAEKLLWRVFLKVFLRSFLDTLTQRREWESIFGYVWIHENEIFLRKSSLKTETNAIFLKEIYLPTYGRILQAFHLRFIGDKRAKIKYPQFFELVLQYLTRVYDAREG